MNNVSLRAPQLGLSIVETMVGLAIGLFIVGGALKLFVDNLDSNRRLLIETRVNQDLRAAADLIARDLRRAGYWTASSTGVWQAATAPTANPHAAVDTSVPNVITFAYDKTNPGAGFQLSDGAIWIQTGTGWQQLTDRSTMTVDRFEIVPLMRKVCLLPRCANPCPAGVTPCPPIPDCPNSTTDPMLTIRQYQIVLRGYANVDTRVVRQINEIIRVRNDQLTGSCPV